ncbi:MAG: hypothetical protein ABSB35_21775 [Bryobacteraceae bacterium]|jgi:hypothetical protein
MSKNVVVIVNPIGNRYTSQKRAADFVRRGLAEFTPAGELRLLDHVQHQRVTEQRERDANDREFRGGRKIFVWSGARKGNRFTERESTPGVSRC